MNTNLSHTEQEMFQSQQVCETFDFNRTSELAKKIGDKRIIFTGMGSSLIFPGKQAKNRALQLNIKNRVEAYLASDLFQYNDFSDTYVFLCSNSGKTKEAILLLEHAQKYGATCVAVTAKADSILATRCKEKLILTCGFEQGIAATKSVVEQGLLYDSLIFHVAKNQGKDIDFTVLKEELRKTGEAIEENINLSVPADLMQKLASSKHYFFVGLENGVAEEITLKAYEITRRLALFYPDTHLVHGVEEAINGDVAVIFEPKDFSMYLSDFNKFQSKTGTTIFGLSTFDVSDIQIVKEQGNKYFNNYCLLSAGWGLLRSIANSLSIDIDYPIRASKVGNPFEV